MIYKFQYKKFFIKLASFFILDSKKRKEFRSKMGKYNTEKLELTSTGFYFQSSKMQLANAIIDKNGFGMLNLMLESVGAPKHYYDIFYKAYYYKEIYKDLIFIDCGAWAGQFSDVGLHLGGIVYIFEPNIYLAAMLRAKYKDNKMAIIHQKAVSNENFTTKFAVSSVISQANTIETKNRLDCTESLSGYDVEVVDLTQILQEILKKHDRIYFIKLDIEGAEFKLVEKNH